MATTRLALELIARNRARAELNAFQRQLGTVTGAAKSFTTAALGMVGVASVGMALKSVTSAALQQEKAVADLSAALRSHGEQTSSTVKDLSRYAAELQKVTVYGDELIISQMAYARNLGVSTDKLKDATRAAIGLAAAYRIDLATAMQLVGRASQGQTSSLTRYGIVLDDALTAEEKFNELLKIGAERFGLAAEAAKTSEGALLQFKNTVGDLQEELGKELLPALTATVQKLNAVINAIPKAKQGIRDVLKDAGVMAPVATVDWLHAPNIGQALRDYQAQTQAMDAARMTSEAAQGRAMLAQATEAQNREIEIEQSLVTMDMAFARMAEGADRKSMEAGRRVAANMQQSASAVSVQWQAVGQTMEYSITSAIDRMIWEGQRWQDAMISIAREVMREILRVMVIQPLVRGVLGGLGVPGYAGAPAPAQVNVASAEGNVFQNGRLVKFARGGVYVPPERYPPASYEDMYRRRAYQPGGYAKYVALKSSFIRPAFQELATKGNLAWRAMTLPRQTLGSEMGRLKKRWFADGGVVTRPTFFPMAGGTGLMGEAGPEAIMPLERIGGKLGVSAVAAAPVPPVINIINSSGAPIRMEGPPIFSEREWVVSLVAEDYHAGGIMRGIIGPR